MASYEPPTENLAIFDPSVFTSNDTPLTISEAAKYFLKYPNAQGTENLQTTNVNGVLTANAGIKSNSVEPIAITDTENICATQTSGLLNIGTNAGRTGTITIGRGTGMTTSIANMDFSGNIITMKGGLATITANGGNLSASVFPSCTSGSLDIASSQTSGLLNIGTGNRTTAGQISIGTGLTSNAAVCIGQGAGAAAQQGSLQLEAAPSQNIRLGRLLTAGDIQIGQGQTDGRIEIGFGQFRTPNGIINIGNNTSSGAPINIGKFIVPAPSNANQTLTTSGNTAGFDNSNASGNCVLFPSSVSGAINFANAQTTGRLFIGTGNRNSNGTAPTGEIGIATGSATGSGSVGCLLNIGTGARTINSDINIGTGLRDSTSHINIGYCATTGVNNGALHLQDGDQNAANIHIQNGVSNSGNIQIGNGASNSGNCNILTGASNSGDVSISTGATSSGDVFIGNNANAAGVLQLNSRNINIGTNGATNTVLALNAPLQPNYGGLLANTSSMIGYLFNPTASNLLAPTSGGGNICDFSLPNGVWMVTATARLANVSGVTGQYFRVSLSKTSGTNDATTLQDYASSGVGGTVYVKATGIFQCTGSTTIYYVMAIGTVGSVSIVSPVNIQAVRIA
jgi:hypothetical protein